jgi:ABC-type antimicrobial peptide transport system permease subunit
MATYVTAKKDQDSTQTLLLVLGSVILIMFGFVLAGPWLTKILSRIAAKRARRAQVLLATKRIAAQPKQVFRSVSGVVIALFAGSFFLTAVSGMSLYEQNSVKNNGYSTIRENAAFISASKLPHNFAQTLREQSYITSVAEIQRIDYAVSVMPCPTLSVYTSRECSGDNRAQFAALNLDAPTTERLGYGNTATKAVQNAGFEISDSGASAFDKSYFVSMNSNSHIDELRSLVATSSQGILADTMYVVSGTYAKQPIVTPLIRELSGLTYAGIIVTMLIAMGSLVVSTIGGLLERRRSLLTLHLGGMTIPQLKIMVIIESLIPLVVTSILAATAGVGTGYLLMQMVSLSLDAVLSPIYCVVVLGSLIVSALAIYLTLPIIGSLTSLETNRTE